MIVQLEKQQTLRFLKTNQDGEQKWTLELESTDETFRFSLEDILKEGFEFVFLSAPKIEVVRKSNGRNAA